MIFKAFNNESFSTGASTALPPKVPYRGYQLKDLTLVPRPVRDLPVESWQPIVSVNPRGLEFMIRHWIKGAWALGAATMQAGPIQEPTREGRRARRQGPQWQVSHCSW